jgi:hypothetical protein
MIPVILVVKLLEELGGVELLAAVLGPLMSMIGLPDSMGSEHAHHDAESPVDEAYALA